MNMVRRAIVRAKIMTEETRQPSHDARVTVNNNAKENPARASNNRIPAHDRFTGRLTKRPNVNAITNCSTSA